MVDAVPQNIETPIPPLAPSDFVEQFGLGKVAFDAYSAQVGGRTYDDKPIPTWEQVTDAVRGGWNAAAQAIAAEILAPLDMTAPIRPRSAASFHRSALLDPASMRRPVRRTVESPASELVATAGDGAPAPADKPKIKTRREKHFVGTAYRGKVDVPEESTTLERDGLTFTRSTEKPDRFEAPAPMLPDDPESLPPMAPTEPTDAPPPTAPVPGPPQTRHG
jgi:hypothetical protein